MSLPLVQKPCNYLVIFFNWILYNDAVSVSIILWSEINNGSILPVREDWTVGLVQTTVGP